MKIEYYPENEAFESFSFRKYSLAEADRETESYAADGGEAVILGEFLEVGSGYTTTNAAYLHHDEGGRRVLRQYPPDCDPPQFS